MGAVQSRSQQSKKRVKFAHVPIDRYEQLITRYKLLLQCVKKLRENENSEILRNKFAVMATAYLENGHGDIHVTQEMDHLNKLNHVMELIEEFCPQQDNLTDEQVTARSVMLLEKDLLC